MRPLALSLALALVPLLPSVVSAPTSSSIDRLSSSPQHQPAPRADPASAAHDRQHAFHLTGQPVLEVAASLAEEAWEELTEHVFGWSYSQAGDDGERAQLSSQVAASKEEEEEGKTEGEADDVWILPVGEHLDVDHDDLVGGEDDDVVDMKEEEEEMGDVVETEGEQEEEVDEHEGDMNASFDVVDDDVLDEQEDDFTVQEDQDEIDRFPDHRHKPEEMTTNQTILDFLAASPHFTRLFHLFNASFASDLDLVKSLNDTKANLTLFAPVDHRPHRCRRRGPGRRAPPGRELARAPPPPPPPGRGSLGWWPSPSPPGRGPQGPPARSHGCEHVKEDDGWESLEYLFASDPVTSESHDSDERKAVLFNAVLSYHLLSEPLTTREIANNATVDTLLRGDLEPLGGVWDGQPLRVRVSKSLFPFPGLRLNFHSKTVPPFSHLTNVHCSNGIIHGITHPLIPPPSVLQQLLFHPRFFSVLTTALYKTGLDKAVKWDPNATEGKDKGSGALTLFAPTNRAFSRLPPGFRAYLFSPKGERLLRKILQYHVVPSDIVFTDYLHHVDAAVAATGKDDQDDSIILQDIPSSPLPGRRRPRRLPPAPRPPRGPPRAPRPGRGRGGRPRRRLSYHWPPLLEVVNRTSHNLSTLLEGRSSLDTVDQKAQEFETILVDQLVLRPKFPWKRGRGLRFFALELNAHHGHCHCHDHDHDHGHDHGRGRGVRALVRDGIARNGAVHVVDTLLRPLWHKSVLLQSGEEKGRKVDETVGQGEEYMSWEEIWQADLRGLI